MSDKAIEYEIIAKIKLDEEAFKKVDAKIDTLSKPRKINLDTADANAKLDALASKMSSLGGGGGGVGFAAGVGAGAFLGKFTRTSVSSDAGMSATTSMAPASGPVNASNVGTGFAFTAPGLPCRNCGAINPPGATFCRVCGNNVNGSAFHRFAAATGQALNTAGNVLGGIGSAVGMAANAVGVAANVGIAGVQAGAYVAGAVGRAFTGHQKEVTLADLNENLAAIRRTQYNRAPLTGIDVSIWPSVMGGGNGGGGGGNLPNGVFLGGGGGFGGGGGIAGIMASQMGIPSRRIGLPLVGAGGGSFGGEGGSALGALAMALGTSIIDKRSSLNRLLSQSKQTSSAANAASEMEDFGGSFGASTLVDDEAEVRMARARKRVLTGSRYNRNRRPGSAGYFFSDIVEGGWGIAKGLGSEASGAVFDDSGSFNPTFTPRGKFTGFGAQAIVGGAIINGLANYSRSRNQSSIFESNSRIARAQGEVYMPSAGDMYREGGGAASFVSSVLPGGETMMDIKDSLSSFVWERLGYGHTDTIKEVLVKTEEQKRLDDLRGARARSRAGINFGNDQSNLALSGEARSLAFSRGIVGQNDPIVSAQNDMKGSLIRTEESYKTNRRQVERDTDMMRDTDAYRFASVSQKATMDSARETMLKRVDANFAAEHKLIRSQGQVSYGRAMAGADNTTSIIRISEQAVTANAYGFNTVGANLELAAQIQSIDGIGGARWQALQGAKGDDRRTRQINDQYDSQVRALRTQQAGNSYRQQQSIDVQNLNTAAIRMATSGNPQGASLLSLRARAAADMVANSEPSAVIARGGQYSAEKAAMLKEIGRSNFLYNEGTSALGASARIEAYEQTGQGASAQVASIEEDTVRAIRGVNPDQPGYGDRIEAIRKLGKQRLKGIELRMAFGGGLTAENVGAYQSHGGSPFGPGEDVMENIKKAQDNISSASNSDFAKVGMGGDASEVLSILSQIAKNTAKMFGATE